MEPKWFNVNVKARIWSSHSDNSQKQGWMYPPGAIWAVDEYKGSYQFEEFKVEGDGIADFYAHEGYEQLWIRATDVTTLPFEDDVAPPPVEPGSPAAASNEALGAAFRLIVNFILGR